MTFFERSQSFPPILVRLLARHKGGRPLTSFEIAERSGVMPDVCNIISTVEVLEISKQWYWKGIGALEMFSFLRGCGLMFDDSKAWRRVTDYLRRSPNLEYLRKSAEWDSYYKPLLIRWRSSYPTIPDNIHKPVRDLLIRLTPILKVKV